MILTAHEILDLARFAGLTVTCDMDPEWLESEIMVEVCPFGGLLDEDHGARTHYAHVASLYEYPEEGSVGLGPELKQSLR